MSEGDIMNTKKGMREMDENLDKQEFKFVDAEEVKMVEFTAPSRNITFHDDKRGQIGELNWDDGVMKFIGDAEESAQIFFNHIIKLVCVCACQKCEDENSG